MPKIENTERQKTIYKLESAVKFQNQHKKEEQLNSSKEFCLNEPILFFNRNLAVEIQ